MDDYFTWNYLATSVGAVAATMQIVNLTKELKFFKNIKTRNYAYLVGLTIIILASIFTGEFRLINIPLYFLNAIVVSSSANGIYDYNSNMINKNNDNENGGQI